jgi:hypothetical protein
MCPVYIAPQVTMGEAVALAAGGATSVVIRRNSSLVSFPSASRVPPRVAASSQRRDSDDPT